MSSEITLPLLLEQHLSDEIVTIYVGPKRKKFIIHKSLLCKSADFFKGAFRHEFKEGREGVMYMPEDEPGAFALFVDYIYRSKIPTGNTENHLNNLYDFYYLADKLCLTGLKDKIMDAIQDMAVKYDLRDQLITHKIIRNAMKQASPTNVGLKCFTIRALVFVYLLRRQKDPELGDDSLIDGNQDTQDNAADQGPPFLHTKKRDLKEIWELCKSNFDFYFGFHTTMEVELQFRDDEAMDPRDRDEEDAYDRCFFHCHEVGFDCRANEAKEEELKFIPDSPGKN